jgi:diguanylate cyclase (GGDEF)-like protein/PAS domain S-box-containing protein
MSPHHLPAALTPNNAERLSALFEAVPVGLVLYNAQGEPDGVNSAARQILDPAEPVPTAFTELACHALQTREENPRQLVTLKTGQGRSQWMEVRVALLPGAAGQPTGCVVAFSDQTEQLLAGKYMELAYQTADIGYWSWSLPDDILELSDSWVKRLGLKDNCVATRDLIHPDDQERCKADVMAVLSGRQATFKFEERLRTGNGEWRWVLCGGAVTERDAQGKVTRLAGIQLDIDEQKRAEAALHLAATTDTLTGLPNRLVMGDRLERALASARRHGQFGALLYLDLDHFKRINDSFGHGAGDELLQKISARLLSCLREEDTLARMGGDEMMVLLPQLGEDLATAQARALAVGDKLLKALEAPVEVDEKELTVGASVGISLFPKSAQETGGDLIREADTAMYGAKGQARGSVHLYEASMQYAVTQRLQFDHDLRQATVRDEFELFIQGKWAPDGTLAGGELLLRWNHPQRGWVSPAEFIPVAEESELIVQIGRWVMQRTCAIAHALRGALPGFVVSMNVSPKQLRHPGFAKDLQRTLADAGLPPEALILEITEGVLLEETLARQVVHLSEAGYRFSLDDFGTGYSSLAYLKRLPVHELKIDRTFVRDLDMDSDNAALVLAILSIARRFGIHTVAEGVETQAQADFLVRHGCELMQGFLYHRPQPWPEFLRERLAARSVPGLQ